MPRDTTRFTCSTSMCPGSTESHRESAHTVPGLEPRVVDTPVGKLGLSVCYDMRFPELFRVMSRQGADLFVVPSAFTVPTGKAHWESLLRARAIENLCGADCAGAMGRAPQRTRDLWRLDDHRSLGHRLLAPTLAREGTGVRRCADLDTRGAHWTARTRFPRSITASIYNTMMALLFT